MIISDQKFLRIKSEEVDSSEVDELIRSLERELYFSAIKGRPGIGLAAPQIGIHKKAAIIRIFGTGQQNVSINLVNAKIEKGYNQFVMKDEGCLSIDNALCNTLRYQEIYVVNNLVEPHSFVATGLIAVAIQHELDHLDGILVIDRKIPEINPGSFGRVKPKPNDPCFCGSNKKYKKCCQSLIKGNING